MSLLLDIIVIAIIAVFVVALTTHVGWFIGEEQTIFNLHWIECGKFFCGF